MSAELFLIGLFVATLIWLALYMRAQKNETSVEALIQQGEYDHAAEEAERSLVQRPQDAGLWLHRGDALQLAGRFGESEHCYRTAMALNPRDAAPREGVALSMAHRGVDLAEARAIMEQTIAALPEIQEFQALTLSYIMLRSGERDEALRLFQDNAELLEVRFEADYTDPDDLLAETVYLYSVLSEAAGDSVKAAAVERRVKEWAPRSVFARLAQVKDR